MLFGIAPILFLLCYFKINYATDNRQLNKQFYKVHLHVYESPVTSTYSMNCDLHYPSRIKALNKIIIIILVVPNVLATIYESCRSNAL